MAFRLLIALLAALAMVGAGYWWGSTATGNAWQARQAQAQKDAAAALDQERQRGAAAAARYLSDQLDQEDRHAALATRYQDLRRRAPLVVRAPVVACAQPAHASATPGAPGTPGAQGVSTAVDAEPADRLTLAAVRMWNGVLTGIDAPASACGAAGAAEGADAACAQSSGLTLDDAWANHAANARSCAADRQRYQALIDFLNRRQEQP